jgi:hypothetical protein
VSLLSLVLFDLGVTYDDFSPVSFISDVVLLIISNILDSKSFFSSPPFCKFNKFIALFNGESLFFFSLKESPV